MKEITYNFITGLKELSEKYNLIGFFDIELSSTSFKARSYYTEFYIDIDGEDFTATSAFNLRSDMRELLSKTKYPANLEYAFTISVNSGTSYYLLEDSYEPLRKVRQPNKIEFTSNIRKTDTQYYTLSLDKGEIILKKDHSDKEEYFKENPEIIDFLNSFIDNKIPKTTSPAVKELIKDIRKIRENIKDYISCNLVSPLNFGLHYNNNELTGVYSLFEYYVCKDDYYIDGLNKLKFTSDLPAYALFREVDMANFTEIPMEYTKTKPFTTSKVTNDKQYFEKVIENLIQNTDIKLDNIKSLYINLDMLDYGSMHVQNGVFKITISNKLLAQVEFVDYDKVSQPDFFRLKENIHKFLYETHGEGYSILVTELEDDDSEYGGISYPGYTLLEFIQETGESLNIINDKDKLNADLKDAGIKPINY
jgi:hypothetical protein